MTLQTTTSEKAACPSCGAVRRDGAFFCYNCGGPLSTATDPTSASTGAATADSTEHKGKAGLANGRRRRATMTTEIVWETQNGQPFRFVLFTLLIFVAVAFLVVVALIIR